MFADRLRGLAERPWAARAALAVVLLVNAPALTVGWLHDDLIQRAMVGGADPALHRAVTDLYCFSGGPGAAAVPAFEPWWRGADTTICFFRPLASLSIAFDHLALAAHPFLAHVHGLLWFLSLLYGIHRLGRKIFGEIVALVSVVIFGVASYTGTPVAWIAARHTILAAALGTWSLVAYVHGHRARRPWAWALALGLWGIALLAGEGALAVVGYVVAWEALVADDAPVRRLARAAVPAGLAAAYFGIYARVGHGAAHSGAYLDPVGHPEAFFAELPGRLLALLGEAVLGAPSVLYSLGGRAVPLAVAGVVALGVVIAALPSSNRRVFAFLGFGALLAVIPATAGTMGGRLLMAPGVGLVLLFAASIVGEGEPAPRGRRVARTILALGTLLFNPLSRTAQTRLLAQTAVAEAEIAEPPATCAAAQDLFLVGTNDFSVGMYAPYVLVGLAPPRTWHQLSAADGDVEVERVDAHTLRLRGVGETRLVTGLLATLFRDEPLRAGDTSELRLSGGAIGHARVEADGALRVDLPTDLDDPRSCWLTYDGRRLQPLPLPPAGPVGAEAAAAKTTHVFWVRGPMSF